MKRVLVFGSFDPLHKGHLNFFEQARALGNHLTVVIAHDAALRASKKRETFQSGKERLAAVSSVAVVDRALIGSEQARSYNLLSELDFDVIALGYDQKPSDEAVKAELKKRGKSNVEIVRLKAYKPEKYKSTLIRHLTSDT